VGVLWCVCGFGVECVVGVFVVSDRFSAHRAVRRTGRAVLCVSLTPHTLTVCRTQTTHHTVCRTQSTHHTVCRTHTTHHTVCRTHTQHTFWLSGDKVARYTSLKWPCSGRLSWTVGQGTLEELTTLLPNCSGKSTYSLGVDLGCTTLDLL